MNHSEGQFRSVGYLNNIWRNSSVIAVLWLCSKAFWCIYFTFFKSIIQDVFGYLGNNRESQNNVIGVSTTWWLGFHSQSDISARWCVGRWCNGQRSISILSSCQGDAVKTRDKDTLYEYQLLLWIINALFLFLILSLNTK